MNKPLSGVAEEMLRQEYMQNSRYFDSMKERIKELESRLTAMQAVVDAVKHCGANIQTIGNGFNARNVYVVEREQMDAIGKSLAALDGETK